VPQVLPPNRRAENSKKFNFLSLFRQKKHLLIKWGVPLLMMMMLLTHSLRAQTDYIPAENLSDTIATSITGPVETACDRLDYRGHIWDIYVWAGPKDDAGINWDYDGVLHGSTTLQEKGALLVDVAFVYLNSGSVLYTVVSYKEPLNDYPQCEVYQWNGTIFSYIKTYTLGSVAVNTAIHLDGDGNGRVVINWDELNSGLGEIHYTCGNILKSSPFDLSIDFSNTRKLLYNNLAGNDFTYPDVAITTDDTLSIVCFSFSELDGAQPYLTGLVTFSCTIYDNNLRLNNTALLSDFDPFIQHPSASSSTSVGKTRISLTERHNFSNTKMQPAITWEEITSGVTNLFLAMSYWSNTGFYPRDSIDISLNYANIFSNPNSDPVIINSMSDSVIITGWQYGSGSGSYVPNSIEPLCIKTNYSPSDTIPSLTNLGDFYLGVGEPIQHGGSSSYPLHDLSSLSLAGKQSREILYFFFDQSDNNLYAKHSNPDAVKLRKGKFEDGTHCGTLIYPNPAGNYCVIKSENYSDATLFIYDLQGRNLQTIPFKKQENLNLNGLKSGIYFVELKTQNRKSEKAKLLINHE
jgi:hypothetical protein